jgi:hypothetical protein
MDEERAWLNCVLVIDPIDADVDDGFHDCNSIRPLSRVSAISNVRSRFGQTKSGSRILTGRKRFYTGAEVVKRNG